MMISRQFHPLERCKPDWLLILRDIPNRKKIARTASRSWVLPKIPLSERIRWVIVPILFDMYHHVLLKTIATEISFYEKPKAKTTIRNVT